MRSTVSAALLLGLVLGLGAAPSAIAADPEWRIGSSLMGKPKYEAGFKHFDYVNPNAPKGGTLRLSHDGTFDSFNPVTEKGNPAEGLGLVFQHLMTGALDEISTEYGDVAEALKYPDDFAWVTYRLNPKARWHDGTPITAEDVVWSFKAQVDNDPSRAFYYKHVTKAEVTAPGEVTFTFDQAGNRELPQIVGQMIVLSKAWYEGTSPDGKKRSIADSSLEPPLGSGPYRIDRFEAGRYAVFKRVENWWAADLPAHVGTNNFDEIRYEYFREETAQMEAFKSDGYDVRFENIAKNWATAYDFPARVDGRVVLDKIPQAGRGIMVGFLPNIRRAKFADPRVRRALSLTFDFEDMNRTLFYGEYERISSYFYPTELASANLPEGAELEILKEAEKAGPIPAEVFSKPFANPLTPDAGAARANLKEALALLAEAGWVQKDGKLVSAKTGEPFRIELLLNGGALQRVAVRWRESLIKLGIELAIRPVDGSQYINRTRAHDYDMIYGGWPQSLSPGNEQVSFFGTESADRDGSQNWVGIKNPAVDAITKRVLFAKDRDELVAASRALDRVLLWNHYVVPGWTTSMTRMARWDRFSHPDPLPKYSTGFPTTWWWDAAKAAKTGK